MVALAVSTSCEVILQSVRSSNLNFTIQETPYSMYLTIRKTFTKNLPPPKAQSTPFCYNAAFSDLQQNLDHVTLERNRFEAKCETLEQEKANLVRELEEEIFNHLNNKSKLEAADVALNNVHQKCDVLDTNLKKLQRENKLLENQLEKSNSNIKSSKSEIHELEKEKKTLSTAYKRFEKETRKEETKHEHIVKRLEHKIHELLEYKREKSLEDKECEAKLKKLNKRLKHVQENEAKLKLANKVVFQPKTVQVDENENEADEPNAQIMPTVRVSNFFDIISEEDTKENVLDDRTETDRIDLEKAIGEFDNEALIERKSKIFEKMKISIHEKVMAKPGIELFTDEEIEDLENELMADMEETVEVEYKNMKEQFETEFSEARDFEGLGDHEDIIEEQDFYTGGEEESEIMYREMNISGR